MQHNVLIQHDGQWLHLRQPVRVITVASPAEVLPALHEIETAVNQHNLTAAGFLSYEAAAAFDLAVHAPPAGLPLLWFGLYDSVSREPHAVNRIPFTDYRSPITNLHWQPAVDASAYATAIERIKAYIAGGYTYQVNYTFPLRADFQGDDRAFFAALAAAQQAEYAAYLDIGRFAICSASPELFFRLDGDRLWSKPMKGTAVRGRTLAEDEANRVGLAASEKNRAENVMIVDMIRNDMGRVAKIGSVHVPALFSVERYPTVLQMTSTVAARTDASLTEIMAHMFPCASITGAPKVRTMEIIRELEPQPRGVYCGAIGLIRPGRQAQFNVAIRTVVVDRQRQEAIYGVGSGVVWDSHADDEYAECRTKAKVLTEKRPSFQLLETMLWQPDGGIFLRDEHLTRLTASAQYFNIPLDLAAIKQALHPPPATRHSHKIRLLVAQDGRFTVETTPLTDDSLPDVVRVGLAQTPVHSNNIWLYHKTTQRQVYAAARAERPDCDDVILVNERGELTEATIANIVLDLDGELVTPPVTAGLLAGTMRDCLVKNGRIREQTLTPADLHRCRQIYLINSVRKWRKATLIETSTS